jgi:hypothetical protein
MDLSEQQKQAIREWVASGASLSDVQRNLKTEFGVAMTYIDVRLLVLDLGAAVKDKPEAKPARTAPPQPTHEEAGHIVDLDEEMPTENDAVPLDDGMTEEQEGMGGTVTLSIDSLVVPGAMVSGTVTFSDGTKARWLIDQQGRFGIDPETPGYRPSPADMQDFQMQLRVELQRKGYM